MVAPVWCPQNRGKIKVPRQRCVVHFMRNVWKKAPKRLQKRLASELKPLFEAKNRKEAEELKQAVVKRFAKQIPEAMECLADGFRNATVFYAFPEKHWRRIRSTNGVERLHGEIKRRTKAVGAFPDHESALRLVTAVAIRPTNVWSDRRNLDISLLDAYPETEAHSA